MSSSFLDLQPYHRHDQPVSKMEEIATFGLVALGFLLNLVVRDILPSTQRRDVRYYTCSGVLILVLLVNYFAVDHTSSTGFALLCLPAGLGCVFCDLVALAITQSNTPSHSVKSIGAQHLVPPHGELTLSTPREHDGHIAPPPGESTSLTVEEPDGRAGSVGPPSSVQEEEIDPQGQQINAGNSSRDATIDPPTREASQDKNNYHEDGTTDSATPQQTTEGIEKKPVQDEQGSTEKVSEEATLKRAIEDENSSHA